jgi:prepilin-type N-terminal cleavage/methylation domain-containing protein
MIKTCLNKSCLRGVVLSKGGLFGGILKKGENNQGFSLIELIFALGILSLGFLFLSGLSITTNKVNKSSQNRTAALQLAQEKIETIKTLAFSELRGEVENELTAGSIGTLFKRETLIQIEGSNKLANITVRVFWAGSGDPQSIHCSELYTRIAG